MPNGESCLAVDPGSRSVLFRVVNCATIPPGVSPERWERTLHMIERPPIPNASR